MNIGFCNIVTGQRVRKGDLLAPPFCRIIRNTDMEVEFHVLETELDMVKLGKDRLGKIA